MIAGRIEEAFSVEPDGSAVHIEAAAKMCYWFITNALAIRPALAPMCGDEALQIIFIFERISTLGRIGPGPGEPELPF